MRCDLDLGDLTLGQGHNTLGLWTTNVWNIIHICQRLKNLWPGQGWWTDIAIDRQMDRQGDFYIPPKLCLWDSFISPRVYPLPPGINIALYMQAGQNYRHADRRTNDPTDVRSGPIRPGHKKEHSLPTGNARARYSYSHKHTTYQHPVLIASRDSTGETTLWKSAICNKFFLKYRIILIAFKFHLTF